MMTKEVSARKTTFASRNQLKKQGGSFDQMKVPERRTDPKKI